MESVWQKYAHLSEKELLNFVTSLSCWKETYTAKEDVIIFRYEPTDARSITMDVIYDALVDEQFDTRSTIYFNQSNAEGTTLDVEEMAESDLLMLLQRVTDALADYGYTVTYDKK